MDKPLCSICDPPRRHWPSEPHRFVPARASLGRRIVTARKATEAMLSNNPPPQPEPEQSLHNAAQGSALTAPLGECPYCDRRRAYAAELMRQRRQKAKENR